MAAKQIDHSVVSQTFLVPFFRRQLLLGIAAIVFLAVLYTPVAAQETSSQNPDAPPGQENRPPRQQRLETTSTASATSGDSAAGSIGGIRAPESAKVNSGGAATQSIPVVVPPGTASVQPRLSFTYNSQGENSLLGVGWSVSGLPIIHRCPRTVAQDNFRGGVNYDANDRFCLDGQRLMAISGVNGANLTE